MSTILQIIKKKKKESRHRGGMLRGPGAKRMKSWVSKAHHVPGTILGTWTMEPNNKRPHCRELIFYKDKSHYKHARSKMKKIILGSRRALGLPW